MPESCSSLALGLKGHGGCKGGEGGEKRKKETERNNISFWKHKLYHSEASALPDTSK